MSIAPGLANVPTTYWDISEVAPDIPFALQDYLITHEPTRQFLTTTTIKHDTILGVRRVYVSLDGKLGHVHETAAHLTPKLVMADLHGLTREPEKIAVSEQKISDGLMLTASRPGRFSTFKMKVGVDVKSQ